MAKFVDTDGYYLDNNGHDVFNTKVAKMQEEHDWIQPKHIPYPCSRRAVKKEGGAWVLVGCGASGVVQDGVTNANWRDSIIGPQALGGDYDAFITGQKTEFLYRVDNIAWFYRTWHSDSRVIPYIIAHDRFVCSSLEELFSEIEKASTTPDSKYPNALKTCQAIKDALQFPNTFWEAVSTAPRGRKFGELALDLIFHQTFEKAMELSGINCILDPNDTGRRA